VFEHIHKADGMTDLGEITNINANNEMRENFIQKMIEKFEIILYIY